MIRAVIILSVIVTTLFSCQEKEKELLRITSSRKITDGNAIQNLIYTQHYRPLNSSEELSRYLTNNELHQAVGNSNLKYYFYKDVILTADFKVIMLMAKEFHNSDSAYYYQLRTYTLDGKPIDKMDFAVWDEQENIYCSSVLKTPGAVLSESLKIMKTCSGKTEVFQITKEGRFILSSAPEDGVIG